MNGYADHNLPAGDFGPAKGGIASFDAFPKTKATYLTKSRNGGALTLLLLTTCAWLMTTETSRWWTGTTTHTFSVEKGVSHTLQMNLDIVVAMNCADLHVNVQDAAGDRILAGETLKKDATMWTMWGHGVGHHRLGRGEGDKKKLMEKEEDVHDYLHVLSGKRKFPKTPRFRGSPDACRVYGSLEGNKVQGDFHITARGHGYMEFGEHLDHKSFNFSHHINELSFGPYYPSLINPLDNTYATSALNFFKFQYYLSVVPTIYTTDSSVLTSSTPPSSHNSWGLSHNTVWTNQYAVTEQSHAVSEAGNVPGNVPGIFVKFDIEPITLTIAEEWGGLLALLVRLVNVVSGVLVAGQWVYQLADWALGIWGRRSGRGRGGSLGVLTGRQSGEYEKQEYGGAAPYEKQEYAPAYGAGFGASPQFEPQGYGVQQNQQVPEPQRVPSYGYGGYGMPTPTSREKMRSD